VELLFPSISDLFSTILTFMFGSFVVLRFSKVVRLQQNYALLLYLWHTLFCLVYLYYANSYGGDAMAYFRRGSEADLAEFQVGTFFIDALVFSLIQLGISSLLSQYLFFNIIGTLGVLAFAGALRPAVFYAPPIIKGLSIVIMLLPSLHFWSSAIGKDSISFMSTGLALWSALDFRNRKFVFFIAVLSMFLVRPHIGFLMFFAYITSILFDKKVSLRLKFFIFSSALGASLVAIPFLLIYVGIGNQISQDSLQIFIEARQNSNLDGGSSVNISSMSFPLQIVTYLFRPFPFEAYSITTLLSSVDNLILLLIFLLGAIKGLKINISFRSSVFLWSYSLCALIILAMTTANLGIAVRQKWMFIPMLIYLFISAAAYSKKRDTKKIINV
jgi:hypothetical protein